MDGNGRPLSNCNLATDQNSLDSFEFPRCVTNRIQNQLSNGILITSNRRNTGYIVGYVFYFYPLFFPFFFFFLRINFSFEIDFVLIPINNYDTFVSRFIYRGKISLPFVDKRVNSSIFCSSLEETPL